MTDVLDLADELRRHRVLAIIRGHDPMGCLEAALALLDEGIALVEVSLSHGDALSVISRLREERPDASIGAGTVISRQQLHQAIDAGARFVVTPGATPSVVEAQAQQVPVLAGALTPTEVITAYELGAAAVKLFPASALGPSYLRALRDPLPDVPLVAVGGVGINDVAAYLRAGAVAVGLSGSLLGTVVNDGALAALRERARDVLSRAGHAP